MKVRLLKPNRIDGRAGEIIEVTPARASFLLGLNLAVPATVREQADTPEETVKRQAPEKRTAPRETPEKAPAKKNTRARK